MTWNEGAKGCGYDDGAAWRTHWDSWLIFGIGSASRSICRILFDLGLWSTIFLMLMICLEFILSFLISMVWMASTFVLFFGCTATAFSSGPSDTCRIFRIRSSSAHFALAFSTRFSRNSYWALASIDCSWVSLSNSPFFIDYFFPFALFLVESIALGSNLAPPWWRSSSVILISTLHMPIRPHRAARAFFSSIFID